MLCFASLSHALQQQDINLSAFSPDYYYVEYSLVIRTAVPVNMNGSDFFNIQADNSFPQPIPLCSTCDTKDVFVLQFQLPLLVLLIYSFYNEMSLQYRHVIILQMSTILY